MRTSAPEDLPSAGGGDRHGWGAGIALAVVGTLLVVEFALPGFVAAGFSRTWHGWGGIISFNGQPYGDNSPFETSPGVRAELAVLAPSSWLMEHSELIRRFYMWQYNLAGGVAVYH